MKPLSAVLILSASTLHCGAEGIDFLEKAIQERQATLQFMQNNRQGADDAIKALIGEIPAAPENPDTTLPEQQGTETVAVADSGMLFDSDNSRLAYINNVRVTDMRLHMRCRDRLYIQFPQKTIDKGKSSARASARPDSEENTTTAAPEPTAEVEAETSSATADPSTETSATAPAQPLLIEAATTIVNAARNLAYVEAGTDNGDTLQFVREENRMTLTSGSGTLASVLADTNGDILITGAVIDMKWTDKEGKPCTVRNENGCAYYHGESHKLYFRGPTDLATSDSTLHSEELLTITLDVEESPEKKSSFMPQFTGIRVLGVIGATASGKVKVCRQADDDKPASEILGDKLTYDGTTGDTTISGPSTTLTYGQQKLSTDGLLHLAENGDITLRGETINGIYNRPAPDKAAAPLVGTFTTSGEITFTAATHTVTLPNGLQAQDELSNIRAGGRVDILLQAAATPKVPEREKTGMLNLAIAGYDDIAEVRATGGLEVHYTDTINEPGLTLIADDAHLNFLTAEATFTSEAGKETDVRHNGHRLSAAADEGRSTLYLAPNGDITMKGDKVLAILPGKKVPTKATCSDYLTLIRESGKLEMGPGSRMTSESGILTSRGVLHLTLAPGPAAKNKPLIERYPHLVFNYDGLKHADTAKGGTMQTARASIQCTGPIHVDMLPDSPSGHELGGIRAATAMGNVAIAGKDNTGRLMRAMGDKLTIDGASGNKVLTGSSVVLQDAYNTHTASGKGAMVVVDKKNNARISGEKHNTAATRIHEQIEQNKTKKQ